MNIILDTHVLIWALENNPTLSDKAVKAIIDADNIVFVSAVSVWEIGIKRSMGKLDEPVKSRKILFPSFRRKPESSNFNTL
jgi:PIN domain nuclease of toxin-antitoxin system